MVDFFLISIMYILAIYGVINLTTEILFRLKYKKQFDSIKQCIYVKNAEDIIEVYIRDMIFKYPNLKNISVIDMNSHDDTYKILEKLKADYSYLDIQKMGNVVE